MRVSGNDRAKVPLRELDEDGAEFADERDHVRDLIAKKKPHVECYLIVARTRVWSLRPGSPIIAISRRSIAR